MSRGNLDLKLADVMIFRVILFQTLKFVLVVDVK